MTAWYKALIGKLIAWYLGALKTVGYPAVALLMAVESSIVPIPSELVIFGRPKSVTGSLLFDLGQRNVPTHASRILAGGLGKCKGSEVVGFSSHAEVISGPAEPWHEDPRQDRRGSS